MNRAKRQIAGFFAALLAMAFLTGCGSSNQAAASTQAPVEASQGFQQQSSTIVDNRKKSEDTAASFTEADFSTKEYLYENSIGDSLYYVIVTNNSRATVEVSGNATAKDGSGNAIGAGKMSIDVLGPGETSIGYFYFDSVSNISSVDYLLSYSPVRYYKPVISNLSVNQVLNDQNVTVQESHQEPLLPDRKRKPQRALQTQKQGSTGRCRTSSAAREYLEMLSTGSSKRRKITRSLKGTPGLRNLTHSRNGKAGRNPEGR